MDSAWLSALWVGFIPAAIRSATPLLWAMLGETLGQRAGIVNLGVEGQMLVGAATAFGVSASTGQAWLGLACGALAGVALSTGHALLCLRYRANQFASGLAIWMIGFGVSAYLGASLVGQSIDGFANADAEHALTPTILLAGCAWLGSALFLYGTRPGLSVRAVGESTAAAHAAGIPVARLQTALILVGGAFSGIGGAALSIDYAQTWAEGMTQGRGLVAVGLVIVARWNPLWALPAALLFGAAEALSLRLQSAGASVSAHLLHMLPYGASLIVFTATCLRANARQSAPAGLQSVLER